MAITEGDKIIGYNVLGGRWHGCHPLREEDLPRCRQTICFATPGERAGGHGGPVQVQRDFGNREDRKVARLKYSRHWGVEKFKANVEEYYGGPLSDPHPDDVHGFNDHMGWDEQVGRQLVSTD